MNSVEYIKTEVTAIADEFRSVKFRYGFNDLINCHVVEITPQKEFYNNPDLDNRWIPISLNFLENFKDEDIVFVSSDSTIKIEKVYLEKNVNKPTRIAWSYIYEGAFEKTMMVNLLDRVMPEFTFPKKAGFSEVNNNFLTVSFDIPSPVFNLLEGQEEEKDDLMYAMAA